MATGKTNLGTALDTELKILHGLPLGEFTAARNALAKRLRKGGDAQAADYVQSLPKPTASAWAVNMLFQRESERMEALLAAGEQARGAQRAAMSGGGADELRKALRAARDLQADLQARGEAILSGVGRAPGRPVTDRLAADLQALAFSPAAAEAIRRGWLSADLDPPGFEVLAGLQLAAVPARPAPKPAPAAPPPTAAAKPETKPAPKPELKRDRQAEERQAREAAAKAAREAAEAERRARVRQAEREVERAESEVDFLRRKAEQAETAADRAEAAAEEAQRRAEEARENAGRAKERQKEAEAGLAQARKALAEARKK